MSEAYEGEAVDFEVQRYSELAAVARELARLSLAYAERRLRQLYDERGEPRPNATSGAALLAAKATQLLELLGE